MFRALTAAAAAAAAWALLIEPRRLVVRRLEVEIEGWPAPMTIAWMPAELGADAGAVIAAWMASPAHRATLLAAHFARIGVGRRAGTPGGSPAVIFTVDLASAR